MSQRWATLLTLAATATAVLCSSAFAYAKENSSIDEVRRTQVQEEVRILKRYHHDIFDKIALFSTPENQVTLFHSLRTELKTQGLPDDVNDEILTEIWNDYFFDGVHVQTDPNAEERTITDEEVLKKTFTLNTVGKLISPNHFRQLLLRNNLRAFFKSQDNYSENYSKKDAKDITNTLWNRYFSADAAERNAARARAMQANSNTGSTEKEAWLVFETTGLNTLDPAKGKEKATASKDIISKQITEINFSTDRETLTQELVHFVLSNVDDFKKSDISVLQIVEDTTDVSTQFNAEQKQRISAAAARSGITARFERLSISAEEKKKFAIDMAAQEEAAEENPDEIAIKNKKEFELKIDELINQLKNNPKLLQETKEKGISHFIETVVDPYFDELKIPAEDRDQIKERIVNIKLDPSFFEKFKEFYLGIYEKPDRTKAISGLTKAAIATYFGSRGYKSNENLSMNVLIPEDHTSTALNYSFTLFEHKFSTSGNIPVTVNGSNYHLDAAALLVWSVIARNALFEATIWGPYLKTYLNFVEKHITKPYGDIATSLWGQLVGFTLYAGLDVTMLHFSNPEKIAAGWTWAFQSKYWSFGTLGGVFGGFYGPGLFNLRSKGYITGTQVQIMAQAADVVMPFEGALLASGNPLLYPVFAGQNFTKFGIYALSNQLPIRGMITLAPARLSQTSAVQNAFKFKDFVAKDLLNKPENIDAFLTSTEVSDDQKLETLKYLSSLVKAYTKQGLTLKPNLLALINSYAIHLAKLNFGKDLINELSKLNSDYTSVSKESVTIGIHAKNFKDSNMPTFLRVLEIKRKIQSEYNLRQKKAKTYQKIAKLLNDILPVAFTHTEYQNTSATRKRYNKDTIKNGNLKLFNGIYEMAFLEVPAKISMRKNVALKTVDLITQPISKFGKKAAVALANKCQEFLMP